MKGIKNLEMNGLISNSMFLKVSDCLDNYAKHYGMFILTLK